METIKIRVKLSPLILGFIFATLIIGIVGLVLNILTLVEYYGIGAEILGVGRFVKSYAILVLDLVLIVIIISVLCFSYYTISASFVKLRIGFYVTKYKTDDIVEITEFKKSKALVMYFVEKKFTVIIIKQAKYNDFIQGVKTFNNDFIADEDNEENEKI